MPETDAVAAQSRVRHFKDNAADVLFGEEVLTGELEVVQGAFSVEEEGIATPSREEAAIAGLRHAAVRSGGDRRAVENDRPRIAGTRYLFPLDPKDCGEL